MPGVVFHNGLVDNGDGSLTLYYGAADSTVCGAIADLDSLMKTVVPAARGTRPRPASCRPS
jgi:predicted GH43/DUF377 family glycosyl hydrolase